MTRGNKIFLFILYLIFLFHFLYEQQVDKLIMYINFVKYLKHKFCCTRLLFYKVVKFGQGIVEI